MAVRGAAEADDVEEEEVVRLRRKEGEPGGDEIATDWAADEGGSGARRRGVTELH